MHRGAWATTAVAILLAHIVWRYAQRKRRTKRVPMSTERVVILGASTLDGLGAGFLQQYLERGARHVMIVGRRLHALEEVRDAMLKRTQGKRHPDAQVHVHAAELTSTDSVIGLREAIKQTMQGLDTLHIVFGATSILPLLGAADVDPCNVNASGKPTTALEPTKAGLEQIGETVQRSCDANLKGTAIVLGALLPIMQTTSVNPVVVTVGSVAGIVSAPTRSVYCATKSAQHLLVRSVDLECASQAGTLVPGTQQRRARVNFLLLAPGPIKNSFVATYSVDSSTGPRDNRDNALRVDDIVAMTLKRVDAERWGTLVIPGYIQLVSILSQLNPTYVYPTYPVALSPHVQRTSCTTTRAIVYREIYSWVTQGDVRHSGGVGHVAKADCREILRQNKKTPRGNRQSPR